MTCGYVCPQCEGKEIMENGEPCDFCCQPQTPDVDADKKEE
ncbi:MAG: hypothetical protein WCU83_01095 [Bacteroidia bacterium]|jgi:hypothetical protein